MSNDDLNWLAAQRPARSGTDRDAHDRALLALLRHATTLPQAARRRRGLTERLNTRVLGLAAGLGAAAIAAAAVLSANAGTTATLATHPGGHAVQAAIHHHTPRSSLIRLADDLSTSTATGDATLIQRTTHTGGQDVTVYDLYGDNGTYYFSQDESGLPAQVTADNNQGDGLFAREVAAAREAATGDVSQAAIDLANAPDPNRQQLVTPTSDGTGLSPAQDEKLAEAKDKLLGVKYTPGSLYDNYTWEDAQDAIIAGAGDPQVRAGVLKILATLPGVTVTQGTAADGTPTLVLTGGDQEFGMNYNEQLTINAETGMPIGFVGGTPGQAPATTVDYQVARVTLSQIAAGQNLPSF